MPQTGQADHPKKPQLVRQVVLKSLEAPGHTARPRAYREAGADVLYVLVISVASDIATLVRKAAPSVNFLIGIAGQVARPTAA